MKTQKFAWKEKRSSARRWCPVPWGRLRYGRCLITVKIKPSGQQQGWQRNQTVLRVLHTIAPGSCGYSLAKTYTLQNFKDAHFTLSS